MLNRNTLSTVLSASLALSAFALVACRDDGGGDGGTPDGGNPAADAPPGASTKIFDVQDDTTPVGSSVSLRSVVVTAIDGFGGRTGGFYVQEPEGGAFSGVFVFGANASALAVGDLVDIDGGVKDEFSFNFEDGHSITQVVAADGGTLTATKVGDGTVPAAEVLNSWDLAADDVEAEKWEGVLIQFSGIRALGAARGVSNSDATLLEMSITGPYRMGGSLAQLDEAVMRGDCFSSITGIGDYFFNYKILPRSAGDMVADASGASCLPPEDTETLCGDLMDNDHDGFADCADFSCQESVAACTTDTTVVVAQGGTIEENTRIRLSNVVVTAISADNKKFWVQDAGVISALNGLFVFRPNSAEVLPATIVPGRVVTLTGNLDEYEMLTELTNITIESEGAMSLAGTLSGVPLATLATDASYEGVLVSIPNAPVATASSPACDQNFSRFSLETGGAALFANEDIACYDVTVGQCFQLLNGIMHYDTFNDEIVVLPMPGLTVGPCL